MTVLTTSAGSVRIAAVLLTFNSAMSIGRTLDAVKQVTPNIYIVDSYSTDQTLEICESYGCKIVQRNFVNYSEQRNWAIAEYAAVSDWQLHIDADEELDSRLISSINQLDLHNTAADGYLMSRKLIFLGKLLRYGGIDRTWHCRLFRSGCGACEDRLYDQHFHCTGNIGQLLGSLLDHQQDTLEEWTRRHNRWSDLESQEVMQSKSVKSEIVPRLDGSKIQQKRYYKGVYYNCPLFIRAVAYFLYRYFLRLGFLDGKRGFVYHILQGLWFRVLVDAKIFESQVTRET